MALLLMAAGLVHDPWLLLAGVLLWSLLQTDEGRLQDVAQAALPIGTPVADDAPRGEALESFDRDRCDAAPVVDGRGTIVGVITRSALTRARSLTRHLAKRE